MTQTPFEAYQQQTPLQLLESLPLVRAFNPQQRDTFATYLKAYRLPAGTLLLEENKENDRLFFICEGELNVSKQSGTEETKLLQTLTKGDIAGEISFFDHTHCSASLTTKADTIVLVLDRMTFITLSYESPHCALALALELFRLLTQRLRQTSGKLSNLL